MREQIAQSLLIMYGAGLNDGEQGVAHPSIVITDQLDKLTKELYEEIEKGLMTDGEITQANITGGQQYMVAVQHSTNIPSLHTLCIRAVAQAQLQTILALFKNGG